MESNGRREKVDITRVGGSDDGVFSIREMSGKVKIFQ